MLPFKDWLPLDRLIVGDLPQHGDFPAVYALRDATSVDVLKFEKAGQLRQRIFGNYLGGVGGSTTQRICHTLFSENWIARVELAWLQTQDEAEAKRKESEFRTAYKLKHGRRPSWDLQRQGASDVGRDALGTDRTGHDDADGGVDGEGGGRTGRSGRDQRGSVG